MDKKKIYELHNEHKEWLNKLDFYKADLKFLGDRVAEIASKNTDKEVSAQCDHFANQIEIQLNEAQKLKHSIKRHEKQIEIEVENNPIAVDHRSMEDHAHEREDMDTFERIYGEQRKDLIRFFSKWM
ncbi:MAG: hypothetical protein ACOYOA_02245 [Saprospiraceae bacterium]